MYSYILPTEIFIVNYLGKPQQKYVQNQKNQTQFNRGAVQFIFSYDVTWLSMAYWIMYIKQNS